MVRKVEIQLIDDLDGGKADETIRFSLDGANYEIDLSRKHADKLRGTLEPYVSAAQKLGRSASHPASPRRRGGGRSSRSDRAQNQAIREWAQRKGLQVSDRGRISQAIVEQYEAEAGR